MKHMDALADRLEKIVVYWSGVFAVSKWLIYFNMLLFVLFMFTRIEGAFTLIYGTSPSNIWYCITVAGLLTLVLSTGYHRAHSYRELAERAREVARTE